MKKRNYVSGEALDIYEFIQKLRLSHFIDSKQLRFIQRIGFYINDLVVYKIAVVVNPLTLNTIVKFHILKLVNFLKHKILVYHYKNYTHTHSVCSIL